MCSHARLENLIYQLESALVKTGALKENVLESRRAVDLKVRGILVFKHCPKMLIINGINNRLHARTIGDCAKQSL